MLFLLSEIGIEKSPGQEMFTFAASPQTQL